MSEDAVTYPGEQVLLGGYVPAQLKEAFFELARAHERSASAELRVLLRRYVAEAAEHAPTVTVS